MAPEVTFGKAYNLAADVYSLGIVLFEIFEGKLPQYDTQRHTILLESYTFLVSTKNENIYLFGFSFFVFLMMF